MDEICPQRLGTFDYVLFFGVLYHLGHPLLGLEKVLSITRDTAFVESFVIDSDPLSESCTLEFHETDELGGQIDNWFGPSVKCLMALCRSAGFPSVDLRYVQDRRAGLTCSRRLNLSGIPDSGPASPLLCFAVNNRRHDFYFSSGKDEYICLYFRCLETNLNRQDVLVEIDGLGVPVLIVANTGTGEWQVNVRVPAGLPQGLHAIRVGTRTSGFGQPLSIHMLPPDAIRPTAVFQGAATATVAPSVLISIENTLDRSTTFHGYRAEHLSCQFTTDELTLGVANVEFQIDDETHPILALGRASENNWQINAKLPSCLPGGTHEVRVCTSNSLPSNKIQFTYLPVSWLT